MVKFNLELLNSTADVMYMATSYQWIMSQNVLIILSEEDHESHSHEECRVIEDGGDTFLRNVGSHKNYTAPHSRKRHSSNLQ
jgi:hypothetical protein